jgi:GT2 family glycosyltransferase
MDITLITVTYGQRQALLRKVVVAAHEQRVTKALVVNNGSAQTEVQAACQLPGMATTVIDMGGNTGSATGFAIGFEQALKAGADLLLVLDDDNVPSAGAISALHEAWLRISQAEGRDNTVVLGFRPDHQADVAEASVLARVTPHSDSFFGFCVQDIPGKVLKRIPFVRQLFRTRLHEAYRLNTAPYSGMLFHSDLLRKFGLPMKELVLYVDDTEFTHRITSGGGAIHLITAAHVNDLEASWSVKKSHSSTFKAFLHGGTDFRAFYAVRNQSFFETHRRAHNRLLRSFNKFVYMSLLYLMAIKDSRLARYRLFKTGVSLGERGVLGVSPDFPLT